MNERIKQLREFLNLSQSEFSSKVNIGRSTLSMFESGQRDLKEIHISQICSAFNVNEEWMRTGKGEMFIAPRSVSLDDYAKNNKLSNMEVDIIKAYMEIDQEVRKDIISSFKDIFSKHSDEVAETNDDEYSVEREVEAYRKELEAEKKGKTLSALEDVRTDC